MKHFFLYIAPNGHDERLVQSDMNKQPSGIKETSFIRGAKIDPELMKDPLIINLDKTQPGCVMPELFEIPLTIRDDLLEDLLDFGIDNIDAYDCILRDHENGKQYTNYKVCNVLGLIDVFDMNKSELHPDSPPETAYLFNKIVVDEERSFGHHLFRPYGRMSQIMVSEDLKNYLEAKKDKYPHLRFSAPENFA
jgi:hypothetical protein